MKRFFKLDIKIVLAVLLFFNLISIGAGMGVPIFTILFGLPAGWYLAQREILSNARFARVLRNILGQAAVIALFTFVVMGVLWGPTVALLFDPSADLANFGIPMILYSPRASFIGWIVLMILISPALQLAAAILAAYVTLTWAYRDEESH